MRKQYAMFVALGVVLSLAGFAFAQSVGPLSGSFTANPKAIAIGMNSILSANPTGGTPPYTCSWSFWRGANPDQIAFGNASCTVIFEGNSSTTGKPDWIQAVITDSVGDSFTVGANHGSPGAPSIPVETTGLTFSITASSNAVLVGNTVLITNSSKTATNGYIGGTAPYTFSYSVSPSNGVTESGNSFTFTSPGGYSITEYVTDILGLTASDTVTVEAMAQGGSLLAPMPIPSTPQPIDSGQGVTLTANATGGTQPYTYQWYTGASCTNPINGATSGTFLVVPTATTTYYYLVTDSQGGTACSSGVIVTVNPRIAILGANVIPPIIDLGGSVSLSVSSVSGGTGTYTTEQWYSSAVDSNSTGTAAGFSGLAGTDTPGAVGTVYYYFVASDGNSTTEAITPTFTVAVNPDPEITVSPTNSVIDAGQSVAFANATAGGTPPYSGYAYSVSPGGNYVINGNSITFNAAGVYTVTETVMDSLGVSASNSVTVTVNPQLSVPVLTASIPIIQPGQSETLTLSWSGGTPPYSVTLYNMTGSKVIYAATVSANTASYTFTTGAIGSFPFNGFVTDSAKLPETLNSTPASVTVYQSLSFSGVCGKHYQQDRTYRYVISDQNYTALGSLNLVGSNFAYNITKLTQRPVYIMHTGSNDCMVVNAPGGGNVIVTSTGSNNDETISMPANGNITDVTIGSNDHHIVLLSGTGSLDFGPSTGSNNAYKITAGRADTLLLLDGSNNKVDYTAARGSVAGFGLTGNNNKLMLAGGYSSANAIGNRNAFAFVNEVVTSLTCSGNQNSAGTTNSTILFRQC